MSAQDEQHLYSLPLNAVPMASRNYNDLENKPKVNNVELKGNKSLADLGIPTKTSELTNDAHFATESQIPTKTSEITNDSDFTTKEYVDGEIDAIEAILSDLDDIVTIKHFLLTETFSTTFDNLATAIASKLATIKASLHTNEFVEIKTLCIDTIGNVKPTQTIIIDSATDLLSLVIDWQGFTYYNNAVEAIDIVGKKVLHLTMTNDRNDDAFVSYFSDATTYTFTIEYSVYKTLNLN